MKKLTLFLALALLSFNNSIAQLNGSYTIGTGGDYSTLTEAISALKTQGVNGPVTFSVKTGIYSEQITIGKIPGQGPSNRITFESQSGIPADVTLFFSSASTTDNYIIKFDSATHITFQNITFNNTGTSYARNIDFKSGVPATGIQFYNNVFNSGANNSSNNKASIYTSGAAVDSCAFQGNTFNGGFAGISLDGPTSPLPKGVLINNNIFNDHYYSIYLKEMDAPVISNNTLVNPTNKGISLEYCDNLTTVTSNKINTTFNSNGIYMYQSDGTFANRGLIANNFVQVGNTSNSVGIQINTCTYQNLYHNSVNVTGTTTGNSALLVTSGSDIQLNNNIFSCENSGYALNTNSATAISSSDYNNFYSPSNYMFYRVSTEYRDLPEYKTASSKESNSVSVYPGFKSSTDLHVLSSWLNDIGTVISAVTDDMDGELRNNPPDIGADEYTPFANSPLSGIYTLGSGGNFSSFKSAIDTLKLRGISSSVTFEVLTGDYFESLELVEIPGATYQDSVIFQSQSGNPANVTVDYSAIAGTDNFVILFKGADRFTFKNMTLTASGANGYNTIGNFYGFAKKNNMINCIMNGGSNSSSTNYAQLYSNGSYLDSTLISGCTVNNGYGFYLLGPSTSELATEVAIINNTFSGSYNSIYLERMSAPKINNNTILNSTYDAIHLQYCDNDLQVLSNKITSNSDRYGIYLYNSDGISAKRGLIANNFIQYGNTGNAYGIYLNTCTYENIYHNSVNVTSNSTSSAVFYSYNGSNLQVKNNIFANSGSGYALSTNSTTNLSATDYNNLFTNGNFVAYWGSTAYNDLPALKTASGKDANSLSVNPGFFSNTDLHTNSYWLDAKGTPLASVTTDYDGEVRDGVTPDIGADEFTSSIVPMNGTYTIGATGDFLTFVSAIDTLNLRGVSGPVVFDILNGTYNEQVMVKPVSNAGAVNTITFQSQSGNAADVVVDYNATSPSANYVAWLAGASFVTFQNLTFTASSTNSYAIVIYLTGNATNNQIKNCILNGKSSSNAIRASACQSDNLIISGNTINSGYHAIYIEGISNSVLTSGVSVTLNTINAPSYYGIYLQNQNAPVIVANLVNNTGQDGIRLDYCDNALQVMKNKIYATNDNSGIMLQYCDGTTSTRGLIANNFITIGNNGNANGIYTYYTNYENIYNNSINISTGSSGTSSAAFKGYYGGYINVVNNILANNGPGYSYYANNSSVVVTSDFNSHSSKGNNLAYWGANALDLEELKTLSGKEASSVTALADFVSATDLHISTFWLDNKGTPLAEVTEDIDGELRNGGTPDIGADEFTSTQLPLAGTYIVGSGGNFTTLSEAIDSLNTLGVSDSVIFLIKTGTYYEQFEIQQISGVDSTHYIRFQSQTGNAGDVVISFTSTSGSDNFIVKLSSADYITFKNLTFTPAGISGYAKAFYISGGANHISLDQCTFNGAIGFNSINASLLHVDYSNPESLSITGCTFNNGGYGLYFVGISTSNPAKNLKLFNNVFNYQYYPVSISYFADIYMKSNVLNEIKYDGLYIAYCSGEIKITGNKIYGNADYTGINLYSTNGTAPTPVLLSNNFISYGISSASNGIYLYSCNYVNVYNNTILQRSSYSSSVAFYAYVGSNINVLNNIFSATGSGYALYTNNGTNIINSDYNNLYTNGSYLAYWSVNQVNLNALQTASGKDANSLSLFPAFVSISDLHLKSLGLNNKGTYLTEVPEDIDDEPRDTLTPDMGADEFGSGAVPLAGIYIIGPTGNFTSLTQAVDSLTILGISDSVIFKFQTGTYNEKVEINAIAGATASKYIVFESQTGNPADVVIFNAATSSADNYIFHLKNTKHITFRKLTFKATGVSYASVFTLSGEARSVRISGCILEGRPSSSGYEQALIRSNQTVIDSISVISNKMTNGGYGVYLYGINSTNPISGVSITGNEFVGFYYSVYLNYCDAPRVVKNKMNSFTDRSIHIENCANGLQISRNNITSDNAYYGIVIYSSNGTPGANGIISNNTIYLGSNIITRGIYVENSSYQNIFYNSIHITGTSTSAAALLVYSGNNIDVMNNILANSGSGYSYYVNNTSTVNNSDFNDLYVKGTKLGYWGADQTNLAAFRTTSGKEASSVSVNPLFETKTDLHASAIEIYEKGTPLTAVTNDLDGELRDTVNPDMGADEIYCTNPVISMKADTVCNGDTNLILNLSTGLRAWSTFKWDILNDGSIDFTIKDSISYKFDTSGNFPVKLIISNPIGCVDSLTGSIPVVSPSADAGLSTAVCRGSKVQLKASKGKFYRWWPTVGLSDTTLSNPYASPVITTTYYVEVTENSGCISVDSVTVFVKSVPVAYAGLDTTINFGDSIMISAAPGGETYAWDNGMTGMNITVSPAFSRSYSVFVTKNGCGAKDEVTVFVDNSPLPSFSFTNKLFGILPEGPLGPDNCSSAAYLGITTKDPDSGTQIYGQCSNQVSTTYSGVSADRFRMIFGDQNLTYHENIDANRQKMIYTEGTASLQMDTTGSGTWKNILVLKNVSTVIDFICPDTLKGKMRGEIQGGDPAFYAEYTSTGNNQILAEFTSLIIDSIYTDSSGNKRYTVYDYTFELLPVERPVYVKGLGIVAPGDLLTFPNTGVSLDFTAYIASSDSASATVVYYPFDPPYTQSQDTIATVFNNEFWELGSTLDNFQVQVCFNYDSTEINTSDIQYLNLVYQEYIGGPWTVVSGTPVISGNQICVVTEHFSNWALGITKPDARVKIDTVFSNSGTSSDFVYKDFENEVNLGLKLTPGQNQNVEFKAFAINPGGDLPAGVKKFSDTYWELHADSDIETILEFNPASLAGYDSTTDDGKYTILYRPDAVTDWSALPTSRVRRGMKEVLIVKQSSMISPGRERNYVLGGVDTVLALFGSMADVSAVCEGEPSQFNAIVSGGISPFTFSWMGDDGLNSTQMNPEYTYPSGNGNYNFTLIITDANGAETTVSGMAIVNSLLQISVSNDTLICKGESVTLTAGGAQNYLWSTGDSAATVTVTPEVSSTFLVTGEDMNGCISQATITVNVNTETAGFTMPDSALTTEMISFLNASTGGTEWHWDFGDGTVSTEQNPQHSYTSIGVYPVCLTVDGCDSTCKNIIINLMISIEKVLRQQGYIVFPNPADKKLNVILNSGDYSDALVTFTDLFGKVIYKEGMANQNSRREIQIDLSEVSTGIYFLKIQTGKGINMEKVVVR